MHVKKVLTVLLVLAYIPLVAVLLFLLTSGYIGFVLTGPELVESVQSPDGKYLAYVEELPSIDPPNQSLCVERADGQHYMRIADLAEDVDSIEEIVWSPDSGIVVFHSRHYLTATRVSDWSKVRAYLGKEWRRSKPDRRSTFTSGGIEHLLTEIEFPECDVIAYRVEGEEALREIRMAQWLVPD